MGEADPPGTEKESFFKWVPGGVEPCGFFFEDFHEDRSVEEILTSLITRFDNREDSLSRSCNLAQTLLLMEEEITRRTKDIEGHTRYMIDRALFGSLRTSFFLTKIQKDIPADFREQELPWLTK